MAGDIRVGDIGTRFEMTITNNGAAEPVNAATEKRLIFTKPSGKKLIKDASFTTDGTDGKIEYTTVAGDLDEPGDWYWQGYVKLATWEGRTTILTFEVADNK